MSIIKNVFAALTEDSVLCSHLCDGVKSIFHQVSPKAARYPIIVYSVISDVPALFADNREIQSRVTVRIHIITKDGNYTPIYKALQSVMANLGYVRLQTTELYENDLKIKIVDYKIGVDS